ncbi:MAG TPA: AAA family ATPase [Clostridia bacterium]
MRIVKLDIKSFGKFRNFNIEFADGMNVVYGENEAGKSTLQYFIKAMLFGMKGGRTLKDGVLPPLKRFRPWSGSDYTGFIEYVLDNGEAFRAGRNFATNKVMIHDSSFNDITGSFDISKENGPAFAEKHLGINEMCFEKTVFIKQMDSRLDEAGCNELQSRLLNISQSGFEDVSFSSAQKALMDALKGNVGTGRTTTRPLDMVNEMLTVLKSQRRDYIEKRHLISESGSGISKENSVRDSLELRKHMLAAAKELAVLKRYIDERKGEYREVFETLKRTEVKNAELLKEKKRFDEINDSLSKVIMYGDVSDEDIVELSRVYNTLDHLASERERLTLQAEKIKHEITECRKVVCGPNQDKVLFHAEFARITELMEELKNLNRKKEEMEASGLELRIAELKKQFGLSLSTSIISVVLSSGALLLGVTGKFVSNIMAFSASGVFFLLFVLLMFRWNSVRKEKNECVKSKKEYDHETETLNEDIASCQKSLKSILASVGITKMEDFFELRLQNDYKKGRAEILERDYANVKKDLSSILERTKLLTDAVFERFIGSGKFSISKIDKESIDQIRTGQKEYNSLIQEKRYTEKRIRELSEDIKSMMSGKDVADRGFDSSDPKGEKLKSEIENLIINFTARLKELRSRIDKGGSDFKDIENLLYKIENSQVSEVEAILDTKYNDTSEELHKTITKIAEHDAVIRNLGVDDDSIFQIENEIEELEIKKMKLEETGISLKTALDILNEASYEIQKDFAPSLNDRMSSIVSELTMGKYKDIRADSKLMVNVLPKEGEEVVPVAALSGGTVDQVYLAMRLAAAEMISSGRESLPIMLDEVFAQYDDKRIRLAFDYFLKLSRQKQVIFFTCKLRELETAVDMFGNQLNVVKLEI